MNNLFENEDQEAVSFTHKNTKQNLNFHDSEEFLSLEGNEYTSGQLTLNEKSLIFTNQKNRISLILFFFKKLYSEIALHNFKIDLINLIGSSYEKKNEENYEIKIFECPLKLEGCLRKNRKRTVLVLKKKTEKI